MLVIRTRGDASILIDKIRDHIENKKIRTWKIKEARKLELRHTKYQCVCKFSLRKKEGDIIDIEIPSGETEKRSMALTSLIGVLDRHFGRGLLKDINVCYPVADYAS